ncbi:hypothetical protein ZIOFF_003328 [Zingiber officinale]|uniref:Uncharacterized protein n=1 Tax=Zingiber officinale TaxID=94328 RepID=A0A8J5LZQ5_ZINOF|nr:hypothetical protein ZIOFF_003328 [Zingiber officinale]
MFDINLIENSKEKAKDAVLYSYTHNINGFAAFLEEEEAIELSKHPGVVSVFPNRNYKLHTTHSWEFLGLERNGEILDESLWMQARFGEDTIIGNLDTGVWPEAQSFKDYGSGPIPSKWKGICQNGTDQSFSCNRSVLGYITSPKTKLGTKPAPFMAAFSSQGPNVITPEILKPDITAPGVSVIAAYSKAASPTGLVFDKRRVSFNSVSGTSMSCPHVSGVVGLLRTLHPDWSPAAIKSAIMTTARTRDNMEEPLLNSSFVKATPFAYGSGHVQPNHAMDPGLVYDLTPQDYLNFLCSLRYNYTQIALFSNGSYSCPSTPLDVKDLNYPSITIPKLSNSSKVTRVVKNVGSPGTYSVQLVEPRGISVSINPRTLTFKEVGDEKSFEVSFALKDGISFTDYVFGSLTWSDGKHYVRTPLVVKP